MELILDGQKYVFNCGFQDKDIPKSAGFRWDAHEKRWWTSDVKRAYTLLEYATDQLKSFLIAQIDAIESKIEASKAFEIKYDLKSPADRQYFPYQNAGIGLILQRQKVLLADEQGLGKTAQTIGVWNNDEDVKKVLIICPASLKLNWEREFNMWSVRPVRVQIIDTKKKKNREIDYDNHDVIIINYDIVSKYADELRSMHWDMIACDEVHNIKTPGIKRSKAILGDGKKSKPLDAKYKIAITGTPILNKPKEIYNILKWIDPKLFPNWFKFGIRYCAGHQNGFGWDFEGASNLHELQEILRSTVMVRRLKADVLTELPPKVRQVIVLPNDTIQEELEQEKQLSGIVNLFERDNNVTFEDQGMQLLPDGMQIDFSLLSKVRYNTAMKKIPFIVEFLETFIENKQKVVLMCHHHDVVEAIAEHFKGISVKLTGRVNKPEDRQEAVDRFQNDPEILLFIGTIGAAGVGITLTAASIVVFAELDWTPGKVDQAEDRCHRIGQQDSVMVYHLVFDESLDARIVHKLISKQRNINQALNEEINVKENLMVREYVAPKPEKKKEEPAPSVFTAEQKQLIHSAIRYVAAFDNDRALVENGMGFSKVDTAFGNSLADAPRLSDKQAIAGYKLARKYKGQLPQEMRDELFGKEQYV